MLNPAKQALSDVSRQPVLSGLTSRLCGIGHFLVQPSDCACNAIGVHIAADELAVEVKRHNAGCPATYKRIQYDMTRLAEPTHQIRHATFGLAPVVEPFVVVVRLAMRNVAHPLAFVFA